MNILYLTSSILEEFSISNTLSNEILAQIQLQYPSATVIKRDLGQNPPAHLSLIVANALRSKDTSALTPSQQTEYQAILASITELKNADIVIIGSPMYNLSISSGLKAWIDQICQAGLTFRYTEEGSQGLVNDKPVIIASSRGGIYSTTPNNTFDHQEPYLKAILELIGITNITIVRAEGLNISEKSKQHALEQAKITIRALKI